MNRSAPFVFAVFALIFGGVIAAGAAVTLAFSDGPWYIPFIAVFVFAIYSFALWFGLRTFKPYFEVEMNTDEY